MFLIDWISQSAVALYIYRVGWTYPAKKFFLQIWIYQKPNSTRTLLGPIRPVGLLPGRLQRPTGQTARTDRSDRSMPILAVNRFIHQTSTFGWATSSIFLSGVGWESDVIKPYNVAGRYLLVLIPLGSFKEIPARRGNILPYSFPSSLTSWIIFIHGLIIILCRL